MWCPGGTVFPARTRQSPQEVHGASVLLILGPSATEAKLQSLLDHGSSTFPAEDKVCPTVLPQILCVQMK